MHQYLTFCTFHPAQVALGRVPGKRPEHYLELPAFYQAKRDRFRELARDHRASSLLPVAGGYFQLVDYSAISDEDDFGFCDWLVAQGGVAAIPLSPSTNRRRRTAPGPLCFAKIDDTMECRATTERALT